MSETDTCNCIINAWECPECKANFPDVTHTPLSEGGFDWTDGDGIVMNFRCLKCGHPYHPVFHATGVIE